MSPSQDEPGTVGKLRTAVAAFGFCGVPCAYWWGAERAASSAITRKQVRQFGRARRVGGPGPGGTSSRPLDLIGAEFTIRRSRLDELVVARLIGANSPTL